MGLEFSYWQLSLIKAVDEAGTLTSLVTWLTIPEKQPREVPSEVQWGRLFYEDTVQEAKVTLMA